MKELILKHHPGLDADEIADIIAEYEADLTTTVCDNCRVKLNSEDQDRRVISYGDWENPAEFEYSCPNCYEVEPEMVKPTMEEWLYIDSGGAS